MNSSNIIVKFFYKKNSMRKSFNNLDEFREYQRRSLRNIQPLEVSNKIIKYHEVMNYLNEKLNIYYQSLVPNLIMMRQDILCEICWSNISSELFPEFQLSTSNNCYNEWMVIVLNMIYYNEIDNTIDHDNGYEIEVYDNDNGYGFLNLIRYEEWPTNIRPL